MSLSRDARARFARQISLPEIGEQGQLRLGETRVRCGDPVAAMYLERAGLDVVDAPNEGPSLHVQAGEPALQQAAAFLSGALSAVEVIKAALGVGTPLRLPDSFQLKEPSS
jgi:hypothetical protein